MPTVSPDGEGFIDSVALLGQSHGIISCGAFRVHTRATENRGIRELAIALGGASGLSIRAADEERPDWPAELRPQRCIDVTGDGEPELIVDVKFVGANCCHVWHVYRLSDGHKLLHFEEGHGGGGLELLQPAQGPPALRGTTGVFLQDWFTQLGTEAPFFSLPYAHTPRPPIIFRWVDGRFRPDTRHYAAWLQSTRAELLADIDAADASSLIQFVALSVLLGDWESAASRFSAHSERTTLHRIARELEQRLE